MANEYENAMERIGRGAPARFGRRKRLMEDDPHASDSFDELKDEYASEGHLGAVWNPSHTKIMQPHRSLYGTDRQFRAGYPKAREDGTLTGHDHRTYPHGYTNANDEPASTTADSDFYRRKHEDDNAGSAFRRGVSDAAEGMVRGLDEAMTERLFDASNNGKLGEFLRDAANEAVQERMFDTVGDGLYKREQTPRHGGSGGRSMDEPSRSMDEPSGIRAQRREEELANRPKYQEGGDIEKGLFGDDRKDPMRFVDRGGSVGRSMDEPSKSRGRWLYDERRFEGDPKSRAAEYRAAMERLRNDENRMSDGRYRR